MTTLHLWVSNQEGCDSDCTTYYLQATGYSPPAGITLAVQEQTLSGDDSEAVYAAYRQLAKMVAQVGHGEDMDGDPIEGEPRLTACPLDESKYAADGPNYTTATESLRRLTCDEAETFADWVK